MSTIIRQALQSATDNGASKTEDYAQAVSEALLTNEAIERAARALDENFNPDKYPILAAMFRDYAKTALTAAIEGEQ